MLIVCKCTCGAITEHKEDDPPRMEFDFLHQEVRYVCPSCRKECTMSIVTANKLTKQPLPSMRFARG